MGIPAPKIGVEYDAIRKDLLICHQNRVWQLIQYSVSIQTAFIAGWYYALFEAEKPLLAFMATVFSFFIMLLLTQALERYNYLMGKASSGIKGIYYSDCNKELWFDSSPAPKNAGKISKEIMLVILFSNALLAGFTLGIWF